MNRLKTVMLLATLTALFLWIGHALAGQAGLVTALLFAGLMNFGAYWWSDRIVLRMHGAREIAEADAPELHGIVRNLARRGRLPMPRVYVIPQQAPNAFATGRNPDHAAIAVTDGLLQLVTREELEGVIAHELGHVRNRDTLVMTVTATIAGAVSMLANLAHWGLLFGGGRSTEDGENGAHPVAALASALRKLDAWSQQVPMAAGSPATAHLFIVNPFAGGGMLRLFSTHPPTEARVERLLAMASGSVARNGPW